MFLGVFVGDALGSNVEGWTASQIAKTHGRIMEIPADAQSTDDWQLTRAVAETMIAAGRIDMDALAEAHVTAYRQSHDRWGPTTKEAVRRLMAGKPWSESGLIGGIGNGVVMKIAPVAAYCSTLDDPQARAEAHRAVVMFAAMTHRNRLAIQASLAHVAAVEHCLRTAPADFHQHRFVDAVIAQSEQAARLVPPEPVVFEDLSPRLRLLHGFRDLDAARVIADFRGNSYVLNSLPFTYAFFLRQPFSFETLLDIVNAGGDTDTNASMTGALLGALNGLAVFPRRLIRQVSPARLAEVLTVADRFTDRFASKETS